MSDQKIRVAISQGDTNGIGWEVILKTFSDPVVFDLCTAIVYGNNKTASYHKRALNNEELQFQQIKENEAPNLRRLNVLNVYEEEIQIELGKATETGGKYAFLSLEAACAALLSNKADILLTAPINKHTIHSEQFPFTGHTSYLESKFSEGKALMMLCAGPLKVGLVTEHIPVSQIASAISADLIFSKLQTMNLSLKQDFGIRKPKIAVLGLNPHAGDSGTIGKEEQEMIIPAINKAKDVNLTVFGPYAADGFFGKGAHADFDGILAMYHDQGLAPFKTLSFSEGVNFTAGLSIVRTSPDHGTGFDIAGQGKANENSFRQALFFAIDVYRKRAEYKEITANPLAIEKQRRER